MSDIMDKDDNFRLDSQNDAPVMDSKGVSDNHVSLMDRLKAVSEPSMMDVPLKIRDGREGR